ncbi:hypothetical protein ILYODFUR_033871 [Ilyodon furcidens]|uniref:Uncharacterized protein n=1 Tax=Ilyodon furcidens TaxID=33524 RepID=A0ABV0UCG3_9TELE
MGLGTGKGQLKSLQTPYTMHINSLLLPLGWCYRALFAKTSCQRDSFVPQAVSLMNTLQSDFQNNTMHSWTDPTIYCLVKSLVYIYTFKKLFFISMYYIYSTDQMFGHTFSFKELSLFS